MKYNWEQFGLCFLIGLLSGTGIQICHGKPPNIVIFLSDDQDLMLGSMDVMKYTNQLIKNQGTTLNNAFTTSPICCPSRSSFLTGMYSHNHNVLTNRLNCSSAQWRQEFETRSFATYLQDAGYITSYFGKYLNEYNGSHVPPGWDHWMGLVKNTKYYNYTLRLNHGREVHKDNYEKDYFTDLIVNRSMKYFTDTKLQQPDKPILSFLSFPAPHGTEDAAPQYQNLYQHASSHVTPSFDYGPNPDKHWIISRTSGSPMDDVQHRFSTLLQQKRLQTLRSVDDAVKKFVDMLDEIGELENTYLIYTSDHGYHIGQFRLAKGKGMPYDFDIRIPFFIRGPGIPRNISNGKIVLNIDIAPTLLSIAGVPVPSTMDGRNFLEVFRSNQSDSQWRDTFLVERGKIPHTKIHLAKPRLPSKQQKVDEACMRPDFQHPCRSGQIWTCTSNDNVYKMRKCSKLLKRHKRGASKACPCASSKYKKLSTTCQQRVRHEVKAGRNRVRISRFAFSLSSPNQLEVLMRNISTENPVACRLTAKKGPKIQCLSGSQQMKPAQLKRKIRNFRMQMRILELFLKCRVLRKPKCKCAKKKKGNKQKRKRPSKTSSVHPMEKIAEEMKKEYNERLQKFREFRNGQSQAPPRKERNRTEGRCSSNGMTCFKMHLKRWVTPPIWDGPERCYCTASSNNTYWCIRTLNETANLLYCEFITGFVEYFDLNTDPYQLSNTYHDLSASVRTALYQELAQLRVCKGASQCHIQRSGVLPGNAPNEALMPDEFDSEELT